MRIVLLIFFGLLSCDRMQEAPYSIQELSRCYGDQSLTVDKLYSQLLGRWAWEFVKCGGCDGFSSDTEEAGLEVVFDQENNIEMFRDGSLIYEGEWQLLPSHENGFYNLTIIPFFIISEHVGLGGNIITCEDNLLFFGSAGDGYDNFFQRVSL